jgi:hypothetical protein
MTTAREDTTRLADLLRVEHHALGDFLVALAAFHRERRWAELGYPSLFEFLRRELKLSAGAAQYRKTAAELIQAYPAVKAALQEGDLCLSSVIELAKVLTPENAADVLPQFFGKSARDAAFVAASIRPVENPPRRGFFVAPLRLGTEGVATPLENVSDGVFRTSEVPAAPPGAHGTDPGPEPHSVRPAVEDRPRVKPLDAERARMNITVSRRLLDKLARARDVLSHSHPGATEEVILELGLDLIIERHAKRRGIGAKPRKAAANPEASSPSTPRPTGRSRYVPAHVWRAVWKRDGGRCVFPLENGGLCGSTHQLELDHVRGFALGAGTTVEECQILCRGHQDVSARRLYGDDLMDRYTRPKGGACSEPVAAYRVPPRPSPRRRVHGPPLAGSATRHRSTFRSTGPAIPATRPRGQNCQTVQAWPGSRAGSSRMARTQSGPGGSAPRRNRS